MKIYVQEGVIQRRKTGHPFEGSGCNTNIQAAREGATSEAFPGTPTHDDRIDFIGIHPLGGDITKKHHIGTVGRPGEGPISTNSSVGGGGHDDTEIIRHTGMVCIYIYPIFRIGSRWVYMVTEPVYGSALNMT
jgi:hypothetical protein